MTTTAEVLADLEASGTAQNRKVYRRHGVQNALYGVSYTNLKALKKEIKVNHPMARELWATGNHDARILATMIADPRQADETLLESWVNNLGNYMIGDAFSGYVSQTSFACARMEQWTQSEDEWVGMVGWNLLAHLAMKDQTLDDSYFRPYLAVIERDIHTRKNRVRYSMNNALIAIGLRSEALEADAVAAAQRIGVVEVDHGETNCKTPDAVPYIRNASTRRKSAAR